MPLHRLESTKELRTQRRAEVKENYISFLRLDASNGERALFLLDFVAVLPVDVLEDGYVNTIHGYFVNSTYCSLHLSLQCARSELAHAQSNFT
jgi:hypothetical protein